MRTITVLGKDLAPNENLGEERSHNPYGGLLIRAEQRARRLIEEKGYSFHCQSTLLPEKADVILCIDLSPELDACIRQYPASARKILLLEEAPLHSSYTIQQPQNSYLQPIWERIITWNHSYEAEYITHFDLPFAFGCAPIPPEPSTQSAGLAFVSNAPDERLGLIRRKHHLCQALHKTGQVDILRFGGAPAGPISNLTCIKALAYRPFALAIEDTWISGYVSDLLPACILAGVPTIYWGDVATAKRRFPGTFIPLDEISPEAFTQAKTELEKRREELNHRILACQSQIQKWSSSFVNALANAL